MVKANAYNWLKVDVRYSLLRHHLSVTNFETTSTNFQLPIQILRHLGATSSDDVLLLALVTIIALDYS